MVDNANLNLVNGYLKPTKDEENIGFNLNQTENTWRYYLITLPYTNVRSCHHSTEINHGSIRDCVKPKTMELVFCCLANPDKLV